MINVCCYLMTKCLDSSICRNKSVENYKNISININRNRNSDYVCFYHFELYYYLLFLFSVHFTYIKKSLKMAEENKKRRMISKMKKEFLELDFDGDGSVSTHELESVLFSLRIKLKLNEGDIKRLIKDIDKDGNGNVDLKEYRKYMKGNLATPLHMNILYRALFQLSQIRKEFRKFDIDESGYITKDELLQVVMSRTGTQLSDDELEDIFKDSDLNSDGKIDYEEFVVMMTK